MLTQAELKTIVNYNQDTGIFTWIKPRKHVIVGTQAGSLDKDGYLIITINQKSYRAHRLAWFYIYGYFPEMVDHINGIGTDNRISNLRPANKSQNAMNAKTPITNSTGVKGVYFNKKIQRYVAAIKVNQKNNYVGKFKTLEEAKIAIELARKKYHKDYANNG